MSKILNKKTNAVLLSGAIALGSAGIATAITTTNLAQNNSQVAVADSSEQTSTLLDETVYVFTDASGKVRKTISSDWTKSALNTDQYTKVETTKKAPIELSVKYALDGKEISANDLAGKSGKVTIEFNYNNTDKSGGLYVPYAVMTGLILDNDNFTNVQVDGGRLMNDGSRTVVAGIALPGLQEDLDISSSKFSIPNSLKITADAKDFQLGMTLSLATTEIFSELDTAGLSDISELSSQLSKLNDAMVQLMDGSSQLYNGIAELNDKSGTLVEGINKLTAGSVELKNGIASANSGIETLQSGLSQLNDGLTQAAAGNALINATLSQTFTSLLKGTHDTIQYQTNYRTIQGYWAAGVTDAATIQAAVDAAAIPEFTTDNYQTVLDSLIAQTSDDATKQTLRATKASLVSYQTEFLPKMTEYTGGVAQAAGSVSGLILPGVNDLKSGTEQLYGGSVSLSDGLATLNNSTPSLVGGIAQLKDGSGQLRDGLSTFNSDGIQKLISAYNDVDKLIQRVKDTVNLAKNSKQNIRYVYRTDEIK